MLYFSVSDKRLRKGSLIQEICLLTCRAGRWSQRQLTSPKPHKHLDQQSYDPPLKPRGQLGESVQDAGHPHHLQQHSQNSPSCCCPSPYPRSTQPRCRSQITPTLPPAAAATDATSLPSLQAQREGRNLQGRTDLPIPSTLRRPGVCFKGAEQPRLRA